MVAYNFKGRFADMVGRGEKTFTIRAKMRARRGDRLQLYTGQRTSECRKLIEIDPVCDLAIYCALRPDGITLGNVSALPERLRDRDEFARADGFADYAEMLGWFEETYGTRWFVGTLTRWHPFKAEA